MGGVDSLSKGRGALICHLKYGDEISYIVLATCCIFPLTYKSGPDEQNLS